MTLILRTLIYVHKVSIANVPVYSCEFCSRNEVFPGVKEDLGQLVGRMGSKPQPQTIPFEEQHEWAAVLRDMAANRQPLDAAAVARSIENRTNELLDLLLVASSLRDEKWQKELRGRLSQLSAQYIS
ncbi:hypothetical protein [Cohnella fermenti]|uniref:Uncharacterized protein n=1 Tax=Cohnella fermenti TaxID=2565925 RepID=A0A4S4BJG0_9BACL|nr:hypothetical protein [Cohnella fermenti]THF74218.1 hypothetical protein E6C55_25960 [Cohnella fermenti]